VDNAVQANLLAALVENREAVNQVYNVAVNEQTSLNELFAMVRTLLEPDFPHVRDVSPRYRDFREGDVQFSRGDVSKAQRLLGYQPAWRVGRGLARAVEWYVNKLSPQRPAETMAALRTGTDGRVETFS
jgi:UDP-N-acetylglucosamine 4-epimerase